jgi:ATP-dependent protease Clp ATPase subunit
MLAGPPGHGKTLIGQQLQHMLRVPYLFEDCSKLHHIADLLGSAGKGDVVCRHILKHVKLLLASGLLNGIQ